MAFPGLQHVAITVTDLERSTAWYTRLFGAAPVLDEDEESGTFHHTVFLLDGGMLFGLHTHIAGNSGDQADETRTGLDHIGFALADTPSSSSGASRLDELGIAHGGIKKASYGSGVSFRDPDNIALEFFIASGTDEPAMVSMAARSVSSPAASSARATLPECWRSGTSFRKAASTIAATRRTAQTVKTTSPAAEKPAKNGWVSGLASAPGTRCRSGRRPGAAGAWRAGRGAPWPRR